MGIVMSKRVLIIDDDDVVRTLLGRMLVREGCEVEMAASGQEALEMAKAMDLPPRLVLTDFVMPSLDGSQTMAALRAMEGWERVPVVMLTSKGQEQDLIQALDNGADDYVVKPFHPGELLARLRRFLR